MPKNNPLSKTEMKILIFRKMKDRGLSYEKAKEELSREISFLNTQKMLKRKTKKKPDFKEEFRKLKNG